MPELTGRVVLVVMLGAIALAVLFYLVLYAMFNGPDDGEWRGGDQHE